MKGIFIFLFITLLVLSIFRSDFLIEEKSLSCDRSFLVLDSKKSKESAKILCEISQRLDKFMNHLIQFSINPEISQLLKRYSHMKLVESSDSAYTMNKAFGHFDKIHICLQRDGKYFDIDTIMFVIIHELTHVMSTRYDIFDDHPREFWVSNKFLLIEAEKIGIMNNINYAVTPVKYCMKDIEKNPIYVNF